MSVVVRMLLRGTFISAVLSAAIAGRSHAQPAPDPASAAGASTTDAQTRVAHKTIVCESREGERQYCPATTSAGVALVRTAGTAPCLLGKTWGYDDGGIWTSDGCSGEFIAGQVAEEPTRPKPFEHIPNIGFLLYDGEKGQVYFRLFSYARYLNQRNIDASYTDFFGRRARPSAGEVLRAVQRMVRDAEVPVLRLVVECVAGRSGTGRRRRQSELHVQSLHLGRCRHHLADDRPQHGSPDFPI